jgi:dihydrodipicolinate synthase/N-acetylneuraminate lyase
VPDLRGIWGFPLTPFAGDRVDIGALADGIERQLAGGVDVLCACGAIAQIELLGPDEWRACAGEVIARSGAVPAVVTIPATADRLELAAVAAELGADALLVLPDTGDVERMQESLAAIASAAPGLPLVLYHRGALELAPDDLRRLCEIGELTGLKDGHRDVRRYRRLREALGDRLCWISAWEDVALPFWALGCDAFAPASVAYEPAYSRAWYDLLRTGDVEGARRLLVAHAYPMVDLRLSRPGIDVSVVKAAMSERGAAAGDLRAPALKLTAGEHAHARALMRVLDVALADAAR